MKIENMKTKIFTLLLLLNVSAIFSQETDILKDYNGDFEEGITFWRFFEVPDNIGSKWEITDDAVSGNNAMKLTWVTANSSVVDRGFDNWSANVPVIAGAEYTVKAFIKSNQASGLRVNMLFGFFENNGAPIKPQSSVNCELTDNYSEYELTVTAPANATTCWIAFRMYNQENKRVAGTVYIDNVRILGESAYIAPRVMETSLPSNDVPIASIDVTEDPYLAKNDGSEDATSAFQDAIGRAAIAGGAVVFVPAGKYRFDGNLNIPEGVTLRGEWANPDSVNGIKGTILMPYANKGNEGGVPFISIQRGAGIRNLSIWYPEQSTASVSAYPWTIHCHPDGSAGAGDNTSVVNVTLVNSYNGIKIGPNRNELHYIRNIYGTPLKQGIWLSQTTDIGRLVNVNFTPKYWSNSGVVNAPSESAILQWLQNNSTTGIIMGRSDWEYIFDVSLVGYQTGVQIIKYTDMGPNGVIYGLNIDKSKIGIDLVNINPIGWAISNATINVEGENSVCVRAGKAFNSVVQFNSCTFGGSPKNAVQFSEYASGRLSFQNCTFENWGQNEEDAAIDCNQGSVSLIGNTFNLDKLHLRIGKFAKSTQILDNSFPAQLKIDNKSIGKVLISQEPLNSKKLNVPKHEYAVVPHPATDDLFNVIDFGARSDLSFDNTAAFQAALDSAEANGGGTVYIPAGMYRFDGHIVIPTGVELRGIWDVPHHTISRGSVLLAYEGKGSFSGTPFISMQSGAGVQGFTVWYPEQDSKHFYRYPWSIRTLGENCWIKNIVLSNTYQGVDLASNPSAGHVVSYLAGASLKTGISVDKNSGDGWIENVQYNPHYWARSSGYPQPPSLDFGAVIAYQQAKLDAFKIGSAKHEHILGTFVFAAKRGIYLTPDDGTSTIDVFQHGTDAGSDGIYLVSNAGSKINFINTQLVLLGTHQNGIITSAPSFGGDASFFNSVSWGGPGPTANLDGNGSILIQQMHTHNGAFKLKNGNIRIENIKLSSSLSPQYQIESESCSLKLFGSYSRNGFKLLNVNPDRSMVETDYYYYYKSSVETSMSTGWESNDQQNIWDDTFWGNKSFNPEGMNSFQCHSVASDDAHSGARVLKVSAAKIGDKTPFYKIFNDKIPIINNSYFTYWVNPEDEAGKSGFIDLLFTDGTRLSELGAVADDGLALDAPRGNVGEWTLVKCSIGKYAAKKTIQSVLVGTESDNEQYSFLVDDLSIVGVITDSNIRSNKGISLSQNYPNPFNQSTTIPFHIDKSGFVTLSVYNLSGKKITQLVNRQFMNSGSYEINWVPGNLEAGIYFSKFEFTTGNGSTSVFKRKIILMK